jgi:cellulose synthase/poly-beta-1,6-N-acetylglucosamine synthase-like glycosyltransferase
MILILTISLWTAAVLWVSLLGILFREFTRLGTLDKLMAESASAGASSSVVSILMPARNEEKRVLTASMRSALAQDYPNFEVIAVDDRSTDGTLRVLRSFEAERARLQVIEGAEPPAGWIGKVHALHQAAQRARGEWVLAVDSDVILHPATLRTVVNWAERHGYEVVALPIDPDWQGVWPQIVIPASALTTFLAFRFGGVNDPKSDRAFTGGAFTLMRREALEGIGGFESIKDKLPAGTQLVRRLKRHGYRFHLDWIPGLVRTPSYATLAELWRGYELVAFPAVGSRVSVVLALVVLALSLFILPSTFALGSLVSLAVGWTDWSPIILPALIAYAAMVAAYSRVYKLFDVPWPCGFIAFVGHSILLSILVTSAWKHLTGRGVKWRGRQVSVGS